jgi:molybdenum cofactor guanylyltransferase
MKKFQDITAFVIAGGKSTRFGKDKLLFEYNGIILIEHVLKVLKNIFSNIIIIANEKAKFSYLKIPVMPDVIPDIGPIGGVYSALTYSSTEEAFCFAGDMPFLNAEFIKYMITVSGNHDAVIPYYDNFYEALHAIYTKKCFNHLKDNIEKKNYQLIRIFEKCDIRKISREEIDRFVDPYEVFKNINYMDDLE